MHMHLHLHLLMCITTRVGVGVGVQRAEVAAEVKTILHVSLEVRPLAIINLRKKQSLFND